MFFGTFLFTILFCKSFDTLTVKNVSLICYYPVNTIIKAFLDDFQQKSVKLNNFPLFLPCVIDIETTEENCTYTMKVPREERLKPWQK